jgi:hypothetical protein
MKCFFFIFRNKATALQMAEVQYDVTHPPLRPRRSSARRKNVPSAENVSRDESLASVQWNILNRERKKWYKNKNKKTQEVAAAVGATISATAASQECAEAKSAGGVGHSVAGTHQEIAQARSSGGAGGSIVAAHQELAQARSAGGSRAAAHQEMAQVRSAGGSRAAAHLEIAQARSAGGSRVNAHQEIAQAMSAAGSGAAADQEGSQVRSAGAPPVALVLGPQQKYVLEQNYIFLLEKVSYLLHNLCVLVKLKVEVSMCML